MVVVHDTSSGLKAAVFPHVSLPRRLRKYMTFFAPLNNDWKLFAGARGSNTPTYSGGAVTGANAVLYADDPLGTGLLTARASGVPQFTSQGYQALGAIANVLTYSCAFDNAAWSTSGTNTRTANAVGPDGVANSAYTLADTDAGVITLIYNSKAAAPNDSSLWTFTVYILKTSGAASFPGIGVDMENGTTVQAYATINTDTGVMTARTGMVPTSTSIVSAGLYWKCSVTGTNNSSGNTFITGWICPAVNTTGSGTWAAATTGSCVCWGASLWNGAFAYPGHLQTQAVAASRSADSLTFPVAGNIAAADGFVACRASGIATAANSYAIGVAASGRTALYLRSNNKPGIYDGTERVGTQAWANNALVGAGASWNVSAATSRVALNGVVQSFGWSGFTPSSITVGDGVGGGAPLWGTVSGLRIGRDVSAFDLSRLSTQP